MGQDERRNVEEYGSVAHEGNTGISQARWPFEQTLSMTDVIVAVINIAGEQDRPYYVPRLTGGTPGATADTLHIRVCAIAR